MRKTIAASAALLALAAPAAASASYTISRADAALNARDAASRLYGDDGVTFNNTSTYCRPQWERYDRRYTYHRWSCRWASIRYTGVLRITGHTGHTYGYLALRGLRRY